VAAEYRVVEKLDLEGDIYYSLYEMEFDTKGKPTWWCELDASLSDHDSAEGIRQELEAMLKALDEPRFLRPYGSEQPLLLVGDPPILVVEP